VREPDGQSSQTVKALLSLRDLILTGELKAGDRISELVVVERLGVSRTPIRMALVRLEEEGLLELIPSGGFAVKAFSERDILDSIGAGQDPASERVRDHLTADVVFAAPDWSLEEAAVAMVRGRFRHLVVTDGGEIAGILSVRDVVRCWTDDGAICDVPESAGFGATAA
jgi:CBS domain-containing protein